MRILLGIILLAPIFMKAQQGIKFENNLNWKQVLQKAKKEHKYIFLDCYATWCGPCKWMDKFVYNNDSVGKYFNERYISVKVQMDTSISDVDFVKSWYADANIIKSTYNVASFPTYLIFSPSGNIVHREVGAISPKQLMTVGSDALNPDLQYYVALEKYRRNKLDVARMKSLALKVKGFEGEELAGKIANDYINRLPTDSLFTTDNIRLMLEFTKSSKGRGFRLFRDSCNRINQIDKQVDSNICKGVVLNIIYNEEIKPNISLKNGKPDWKLIKDNVKKYGPLGEETFIKFKPGIIFKTEIEPVLKVNSQWTTILPTIEKQNLGRDAEFLVGSSIVYYLNAIAIYGTEKNCNNLVAAATYYSDSFPTFLSGRALNSWAWVVFEHSNDQHELRKALEWSKRSNELEPNTPEALDTYANLLYKLGHVQEAMVWQEKAVQTEEDKYKVNKRSVFQETLEKMQKGEKTWP